MREPMTLIERLTNPQWVHGYSGFSALESPQLDKEQTVKDMGEAAAELTRLRALHAEAIGALTDLFDECVQAGFDTAKDYQWPKRMARARAVISGTQAPSAEAIEAHFLNVVENPPQPTEELKELFRRYATQAPSCNGELLAALKLSPCPRPANAAPDHLTVAQCMARGECGCDAGGAIGKAEL